MTNSTRCENALGKVEPACFVKDGRVSSSEDKDKLVFQEKKSQPLQEDVAVASGTFNGFSFKKKETTGKSQNANSAPPICYAFQTFVLLLDTCNPCVEQNYSSHRTHHVTQAVDGLHKERVWRKL